MKLFVKTLRGIQFEVDAEPSDTVGDVKKRIETIHGEDVYPCARQILFHLGEILKDETTLAYNKVADRSHLFIMLRRDVSSSGNPTVPVAPTTPATPSSSPSNPTMPSTVPKAAPATTPHPNLDLYGQASSNLVDGSNIEQVIEQILDMGGGSWGREIVLQALRAAYNNPERAVEYLYSGIPEQAEPPTPIGQSPTTEQAVNPSIPATQSPQTTVSESGLNANPLDIFPLGIPNMDSNVGDSSLDFLRNSQQFQALRTMVQANPQILQPMLQELGRQNPQLMRLIQDHQADFLRLISEPLKRAEGVLAQLTANMPQIVQVTPDEHEAIDRLEAMGFDRDIVLDVFFACNNNERLAANYLLDHYHELEE